VVKEKTSKNTLFLKLPETAAEQKKAKQKISYYCGVLTSDDTQKATEGESRTGLE